LAVASLSIAEMKLRILFFFPFVLFTLLLTAFPSPDPPPELIPPVDPLINLFRKGFEPFEMGFPFP